MPFEIWISRYPRYDLIHPLEGDVPDAPRGLLGRLRYRRAVAARRWLIPAAAFHRALGARGGEKRPDRSYWLRDDDRQPWLLARWLPAAPRGRAGKPTAGHAVLALSYGNVDFHRHLADAVDLAHDLAKSFAAAVFEAGEGRQLERRHRDRDLAADGPLLARQGRLFAETQNMLRADGAHAPLEVPAQALDVAPEFFYFVLQAADAAHANRAAGWPETLGGLHLVWRGDARADLTPDGEQAPIAQLLRRGDRWQLRPAWRGRPFAALAPATLDAAEAFQAAGLGRASFHHDPLDEALAGELRRRSRGAGVELFAWLRRRQKRWRPQAGGGG